jgi:hypothetical protein
MSGPQIVQVNFYSVKPLPMDARSSFELPAWPYSSDDGVLPEEVAEYFKQLGIFYYRDSIQKKGSFRNGLITPGFEEMPLPQNCWGHSCYIDYAYRTFKVVEWWRGCSIDFVRDCVKKTGDRYSWTTFNESRVVKAFNSRFIKSSLVTKPTGRKIRSSKDVF